VANFITALKRSGYFQRVEIKESRQDDKNASVQTFTFQLSADIVPPDIGPAARPGTAKAKSASTPAAPGAAVPARKG